MIVMLRRTLLALLLGATVVSPVATHADVAALQSASAADQPGPARNVSVATSATSATITWDPADNADRYRVCLTTGRHNTKCRHQSDKTEATRWRFRDLTPTSGADYFATVTSFNNGQTADSHRARVDLKVPSAPDPVDRITVSTTKTTATLTWRGGSTAKGYRICLTVSKRSTKCRHQSPDLNADASEYTFTDLQRTGKVDFFARIDSFRHYVSTPSRQVRVDLAIGTVKEIEVPDVQATEATIAWTSAANADNYEVTLSSDRALTKGVFTRRAPAAATQLLVTDLTPGRTYYARVQARGARVQGSPSPVERFRLPTLPFSTSVMTYNLCGQNYCTSPTNGIKAWTKRKPLAGNIVRKIDPDLISTQESHDKDTRFVTELPGFGVGAYKSSKTIFYRKSTFRKIDGGWMTLDSQHRKYAVWNEFEHKKTQTPFILVDAHLQPYKGRANDDLRKAQTRRLLAKVARLNTRNLPVIYAGDFNSNKSNSNYTDGYDAPYKLFTAAGIPDLFDTSPARSRANFNSANQAKNPPSRNFDHIDHIFASPDIEAIKWSVAVSFVPKTPGTPRMYRLPFASDHNPVTAELVVPGLPGSIG